MRRYKDAFTPVPPETLARVEDTLRRLPRQKKQPAFPMRKRWAFALAAALALVLCGGAVAAGRLGVLDFLFGSITSPTEEQQQLVQDVNISQRAEMATITVTDAVFDGRQLSMGLVFDTDQPTYALSEGLWLNGTLISSNDIHDRLGWLNQEQAPKRTRSGLTAIANETLSGHVEVRQRVMLLQPKKAIRAFSPDDYDDWGTMRDAARQAAEEGYTPVEEGDWYPFSLGLPPVAYFDTETDYN